MESDPYEIWREAMEEIERQRLIDEYEVAEFLGSLAPDRADPDVITRTMKIIGDKMDEEKEKEASRLISAVLFVRASMIGILVVVFGALTYALMVNKLNGWVQRLVRPGNSVLLGNGYSQEGARRCRRMMAYTKPGVTLHQRK
jgi:hypothetical protein